MPRAPHPAAPPPAAAPWRSAARPAARGLAAATAVVVGGTLLATPAAAVEPPEGSPFISEFHYDNVGADEGERVEVQAEPGTDLTGWTVVGVNGNGGATYGPKTLSGVVGDSGVVVVDFPGLQNGAPDGIALLDASGALVQFLSYEGTFTTTLAGQEVTSTDVGVTQGSDTPVGASIELVDGEWVATDTNSFGVRNDEAVPEPEPEPEPDPAQCVEEGLTPITTVQGTGAKSPLVGETVTVAGVVTTSPEGLGTVYVQDPTARPGVRSTAVNVFGPGTSGLAVGDSVQVTGEVGEFFGLTQVTADSIALCARDVALPRPFVLDRMAAPDSVREQVEGMLLEVPEGMTATVTEVYNLNRFGEIALTSRDEPLRTATDVVAPGEEAIAYEQANAESALLLDDGRSTNLSGAGQAPSYGSADDPVRVGDQLASLGDRSYVLDYRFGAWRLQPTTPVTAETTDKATFDDANPRTDAPQDVGGDVQMASFNVLNYFTTFGGRARGADGPEGLARQEAKIVSAINALGAEVVGIQEIENGAALGEDRDEALATLVDALNAAAGEGTWAFVPSPADLPPVEDQDVIRNAFIYQPAAVSPVGESVVDDDEEWVGRARQPLAQVFEAGGTQFMAVNNHFKSKGSVASPPREGDEDSGDGQGASNATRVAEAERLVAFVEEIEDAPEDVFLLGDFNSYTMEDPLAVLAEAGYVDLGSAYDAGQTYVFSGRSGSLDHVFASASAAQELVTGADVWDINAVESYAYQYDGYLPYFSPDPYRASDHDPVVVGLATGAAQEGDAVLQLLGINDFHGRLGDAVALGGTVEQQREREDVGDTLLLSAGDNIGASPFVSSIQQDEPTIEVLDELGLQTSAVGNHEFDRGIEDLLERVGVNGESGLADFPILGANVYDESGDVLLPEYSLHEVDGVSVGVIGVVTEQTASLVSPAGIEGVVFGDITEAANRVVGELTDGVGDEADVIVLSAHEGAPDGEGTSSLEEQLALDNAFTDMVEGVSPEVDAIFTGHTHQTYAWQVPVPGTDRTRPVVQGGAYADNLSRITLTVDRESGEVTASTVENLELTDVPEEELVATYPRVAAIAETVAAAEAVADEIGSEVLGSLTADITRAFDAGGREDRGSYSSLGGLVADSYVYGSTLTPVEEADFGVVNPGGLRADLLFGEDGVITLAEANTVTPFANDLVIVPLTGAQVVTMLEQQWQPEGSSRPFLALGPSEELTWSYDPDAPAGERILVDTIRVSGELLDLDATYRVATNSFLASGGDNFTVFAESDSEITGLIDFDAFAQFIREFSPLSPEDYTDRVTVGEAPEEPSGPQVTLASTEVTRGERVRVDVTGFQGFEAVTLEAEGIRLGRVRTDADGAGSTVVRVPGRIPPGTYTATATGAVSGQQVQQEITVLP
ncbi:ExeM/NucH family extracellular endonuclease [Pseudokineococcus sp. 1T1Z-3]|uniref:ExeM/NucH family extracellular endonuclease n=1 Tax=Pseudokineococcus sp. 1T1Z-3 TaxID=3132745 RepID=UPI00309EB121